MGIKIEYLEEEIPVYDITVEDNQNFYANNILVHNCNEIFLPAIEPKLKNAELNQNIMSKDIELIEKTEPGQIALCNLSSINLTTWDNLRPEEKDEVTYNLLRASDNLLDYAYYPALEGGLFNERFRAIGVGITNFAQILAIKGYAWDSTEAEKFMHEIMEDIYWHLMRASIELAKERGRFEEFQNTKYAQGLFSFDLYNGPFKFNMNHDWEKLRKDLIACGARFSTVMAIAPTSTSATLLDSTEGIEPIRQLISIKTGTYSCAQLAPQLQKLRGNYELAWDLSPEAMINLASIRQKFVDQGQSFSLYYKDRNDSAYEILRDIMYAETVGLKGLYYAHSNKEDDEEEKCESCSA